MPLEDLIIDVNIPLWFIMAIRTIGLVSFIIDGLGMYMITYHASVYMKDFRHYQMAIQTFSSLVDVLSSLCMTFVYLYPFSAGYYSGIFWSEFHIPSKYLKAFMESLKSSHYVSLFIGFMYKHQKMLPPNSRLKMSHNVHVFIITFLYIVLQTGPIAMFLGALTKEETPIFMEDYPHLKHLLTIPNLFVMDQKGFFSQVYTIFISIFGATLLPLLIFFIVHIYRMINVSAGQLFMSKKTVDMTRSSIRSLLLQTTVPMLFNILPVLASYFILTLRFTITQTFNYMNICVTSVHSINQTLVMMLATDSYRKAIVKRLSVTQSTIFRSRSVSRVI